jgi:5-(carboxyamino)imidazole ribonucleotide synthase
MVTRIGVIGGGQLCRLMGEDIEAKRLPFELYALDPTPNCPASPFLKKQLLGDFKDNDKIRELAKLTDILTYEIELANAETLSELEAQGHPVHPCPKTLAIIQDKYTQASFLKDKGMPVPRTIKVDTEEELIDAVNQYGLPSMVKARRDSYDGRGNMLLRKPEDVKLAFKYFGNNRPLMLQEYVDFEKEISVIAARNTHGEIATYTVGENLHQNNILHMTLVPARINENISKQANKIASETLTALEGAGVFGIEMFVDKKGHVLINEIAPRVHNSGHHTMEACYTSQFEQHLRAISGMPLGDTNLRYYGFTVMHNILGNTDLAKGYQIKGLEEITKQRAAVHMYDKSEVRYQRKMGHFTLIQVKERTADELMQKAAQLREKIVFC